VTVTQHRQTSRQLDRPSPSGLADVIDIILDKGIVIDVYVRVSLVGIEILTIDARIVIASVDTYLRFAEATNRLDLYERGGKDLFEALGDSTESASSRKVSGAIRGVKEALTGGDSGDEEDEEERPRPAKKAPAPQRSGNR
jgi:hypothetical protein